MKRFIIATLLAASQFAGAEDAKAVQQKLEAKYKLTVINAEGGVVVPGTVLVLKKSGLTASATNPCINDYKDGAIVLAHFSKAACNSAPAKFGRFGAITGIGIIPGAAASGPASRSFVMGEKLYVSKIEVKDTVNFGLVSDPINGVTYRAELRLQFPKGTPPDSANADELAGEVFSISEGNSQGAGAPAGQPAAAGQAPFPTSEAAPSPTPPQEPALAPIEAPPPPPDAPPPPPSTVALGMTIEQVVGLMGQPKTVADTGKKKIYSYAGLKITFVDGKVSDIQ